MERAQKKVEARNFEIRKSLLKFDDVMNEQRKIIYDQRKEIINEVEIDNLILDMRDSFIEDFLSEEVPDVNMLDVNKKKLLIEIAKNELNIEIDLEKVIGKESFEINDIKDELIKLSDHNINIKKTKYSDQIFIYAQKSILLQVIDKSWKDHLLSLDHLRQGISLRAYGQKDPLNEYKQEAFLMFENMMKQIRQNVTKIISFVEIKTDVPENESQSIENKDNECLENLGLKKISRNARCPRTGKKYKNCCGKVTN